MSLLMYPPMFLLSPWFFSITTLITVIFQNNTECLLPMVSGYVIKTRNIWNVTHELFSCSDSSLLIPKSNCLLLAWCHLCCVWASIYLMHVIVFNHQEITLNESRKLLSNYFVKQLLWNSNEILRHAIFS